MAAPLRNRNRNLTGVASTTWEKLIYGENSPITAEVTEATIDAITRDDVVAWHKKYWGANNAILVVAGDFKKADMLAKLEATFGKWRKADAKATPPWPKVAGLASKPGVYMVQPLGATPNQGVIRIGTPEPHAGRSRLSGGGPDELHARRRVVLVPHHAGGPQRPGAGLLGQLERRRRPALPGCVRRRSRRRRTRRWCSPRSSS